MRISDNAVMFVAVAGLLIWFGYRMYRQRNEPSGSSNGGDGFGASSDGASSDGDSGGGD